MTDRDQPLFSEGIGDLLHTMLAPSEQDRPPYVHTFQPPEPALVLDGYGQPVLDDGGHTIAVPVHATALDRTPGIPEVEIELPRYVEITAGFRWLVEPSGAFRG